MNIFAVQYYRQHMNKKSSPTTFVFTKSHQSFLCLPNCGYQNDPSFLVITIFFFFLYLALLVKKATPKKYRITVLPNYYLPIYQNLSKLSLSNQHYKKSAHPSKPSQLARGLFSIITRGPESQKKRATHTVNMTFSLFHSSRP